MERYTQSLSVKDDNADNQEFGRPVICLPRKTGGNNCMTPWWDGILLKAEEMFIKFIIVL